MRLSPLSPFYRALQRVVSVLIFAGFAVTADANRLVGGPVVVIVLAGLVVLAIALYELGYYLRFEYVLTDDTLDIRSGVFGRRERELPYRRIQNVDISRNVIQRLLGIAAVGFETAGGSDTEGSLRFVSASEAERLQREIQRRTASTADGQEPYADPIQLYAISPRELTLVGALSIDLRIVGVLGLVGPGSVPVVADRLSAPVETIAPLGIALLALLLIGAWLLGIAVAVGNFYAFRLTRDGDELRYERGLVKRYSGSIPLDKVQSVVVEDNPLKRAFGYASLSVETAGYAPGRSASSASQVAVPIADRGRVVSLAREIEPFDPPSFDRPPRRVRRRYVVRYLIGIVALTLLAAGIDRVVDAPIPWIAIPTLAPLTLPAAHLKWRHRGVALCPDHVATRNGFWKRSVTVVPYYRIQAIIDARTVFQRRWGLATLTVDTAVARSILGRTAAAVDVDRRTADRLRASLNERLQAAIHRRKGSSRRRRTPSAPG